VSIVYPALRTLLANRLQKAIYLQKNVLWAAKLDNQVEPANHFSAERLYPEIPLNLIKAGTQICYVSAIALKLANLSKQSPLKIAQQTAAELNYSIEAAKATLESKILNRVWQNFTVEIAPSGWIYLHLTEPGLAEWLQVIVNQPLEKGDRQSGTPGTLTADYSGRNSTSVFEVLHTHARCCALLRLGMREGLVRLEQVDSASADWQIDWPNPLPWLNSSQMLRCNHSTELRLITQIASALDYLSCIGEAQPFTQSLRMAQALSQDFQEFYAACRIWGEVKATDLALAQVRLGLVLVLKSLLQVGLKIQAPTEL
jgi:arginyl-tRNA synthetase